MGRFPDKYTSVAQVEFQYIGSRQPAALMAMSAELALLQRYFGGVNRLMSQGQMRQIAGGLMNGGVARGAQVLGFKNMELMEELQLAAEPPAPPKRSKYAGGGLLGANA